MLGREAVTIPKNTSLTVSALLDLGRKMGAPVTTKMKKADLIETVNKANKTNAKAALSGVDTSKLTPKQRRRLRKRGVA